MRFGGLLDKRFGGDKRNQAEPSLFWTTTKNLDINNAIRKQIQGNKGVSNAFEVKFGQSK